MDVGFEEFWRREGAPLEDGTTAHEYRQRHLLRALRGPWG